jgi:hypothetical protein
MLICRSNRSIHSENERWKDSKDDYFGGWISNHIFKFVHLLWTRHGKICYFLWLLLQCLSRMVLKLVEYVYN